MSVTTTRTPPPPLPPREAVQALTVLRPPEAAAFLGVSLKTLKRLPVRKARLGHRTVLYLREDLVAYLKGHAA